MKKLQEIDPLAAFPDAKHRPASSDLPARLGPSWPKIGEILNRLRAAHPEVMESWQFSTRSGWYQVQLLKKRRLLYLIPKKGAFRLMMILGRKAVASLQAGPFARQMNSLLKNARHYPEGIAFEFDQTSLDPGLLVALLEAKVSPVARPTPD